ncbi:hypothetical protein DU976_05265 [Vibrio navarrensis]|nr:hypothetical protein [Vibrio navarrensis]
MTVIDIVDRLRPLTERVFYRFTQRARLKRLAISNLLWVGGLILLFGLDDENAGFMMRLLLLGTIKTDQTLKVMSENWGATS